MARTLDADLATELTRGLRQGLTSVVGGSGTKIVVRSNVTPDITIDIAGLMQAQAARDAGRPLPTEDEVPVSSDDKLLLKMIKPEITLRTLGNVFNYAPYGHPRREYAIALLFAFIAFGLIGVKLAWVVCKKI
jgi:hypothetical protein